MTDCAFCAISRGEQDAHVLAETDDVIAFLDENPAAVGHTLVVPKAHDPSLFAGGADRSRAVFEAVRGVALAVQEALDPDGVSVFYTTADLVGRVTHAHVHLLPRYADDDITITLSRGSLDDETASTLASKIRAEY